MTLSAEHYNCLKLSLSTGIGPVRMKEGLKKYGTYTQAMQAVQAATHKSIQAASDTDVERTLQECKSRHITLLFLDSPEYPHALSHIQDAPHVLYAQGNMGLLNTPSISIVGTRNASLNGLKYTENLAKTLSQAGLCVVSGLARGIDSAAHKASLKGSGRTIAVLAGGLGRIYPPEHTTLATDILQNQGLLLSEMPPLTEPTAPLFPRRNRIVSGLSMALCVTESALKSGSLITAKLALEQGREVWAVPGHPTDPRAQGPNSLLKQGAQWLETPQDLLTAYQNATPQPAPQADLFTKAKESQTQKAPLEKALLSLLTTTPTSLDLLCEAAGVDAPTLSSALTLLEMDGHILWHGANKVSKVTS